MANRGISSRLSEVKSTCKPDMELLDDLLPAQELQSQQKSQSEEALDDPPFRNSFLSLTAYSRKDTLCTTSSSICLTHVEEAS